MPARAAYRLIRTSMYWRGHGNSAVSGLALASSSRGGSSNKGSLSIRRVCSVGRLFFSRLTDSLPSQMSCTNRQRFRHPEPMKKTDEQGNVVQGIVAAGDLKQSDQFVATEVFHRASMLCSVYDIPTGITRVL